MISTGPNHTLHSYKLLFPIVPIYRWMILVSFGGLMILVSCKESTTISTQGLNGKWEIYSANRNGRETPYLRGGYFIFDAKNNLTVNITGSDETGPFLMKDNRIIQEGKADYTITSIRQDSMDIYYAMNPENEFMFFLKKTSNEKH